MRRVAWLPLLLPLVAAPPVDAKCAMMGLTAEVLTPAATALPADGGIVIAAQGSMTDRTLPDADIAVQPGWRFDGKKAAPQIETIAPGLAVYRTGGISGTLVLRDGKRTIHTAATTKASAAKLAAPKVKAIVATKTLGRRPSSTIEVTLDGAVPATAVAIIAADAKGTPRSFGRVVAGEPLYVYKLRRCQVLSTGTIESTAGEQITVFWLDAMGRRSPASRPIKITGSKTTEED